jgi:Protein of unknown function (DUF2852)
MLLTFTREAIMPIAAMLNDLGRPAWIVLMILGFVFWWPVGLAILAFMIWSRKMGCWNHRGFGRWQDCADRAGDAAKRWGQPRTSGNRAFDEYRSETLRRLEDEQREFREFLERLRLAKDKAEFDQFMTERRNRPQEAAPPQS